MSTIRQGKVARVIRDAVSDAVTNHLNDPRIEGFVSVTKVEVAADLRVADVYISIFGTDEGAQKRAFEAITHARSRVQLLLGERLRSKFCPVLRLHRDESFKKTQETMKLIDEAASEFKDKDSAEPEQGRQKLPQG
jgi:ribosome-binding factor A